MRTDLGKRVGRYLAEAGDEVVKAFSAWERSGDVDDVDLAAAVYWLGSDHHAGQACPLYAAMCATEYRPGMSEREVPDGMASMVYGDLEGALTGK